MEESLSCVNGGAGANNNENPNSEVPYKRQLLQFLGLCLQRQSLLWLKNLIGL